MQGSSNIVLQFLSGHLQCQGRTCSPLLCWLVWKIWMLSEDHKIHLHVTRSWPFKCAGGFYELQPSELPHRMLHLFTNLVLLDQDGH